MSVQSTIYAVANTSEDVTKRVKMTEIAKNILSRPVPRLDTKLIPGGSSTSKKLYINTDYDYDGNGKNNLNRFSLTSIRVCALYEIKYSQKEWKIELII